MDRIYLLLHIPFAGRKTVGTCIESPPAGLQIVAGRPPAIHVLKQMSTPFDETLKC